MRKSRSIILHLFVWICVALSGMAVVGAISDANCVIKTSALGGPGCFTEGTQIVVGAVYDEDQVFVEYVTKNIEDIDVGDMVFSYDTITGEATQNEVTNVYVLESDHINFLTILDEKGVEQTIETTDAHPFWVVTNDPDLERAASDYVYENGVLLLHENLGVTDSGYWVSAKDLRVGDVFLDANGKLSTLTGVDRVEFPDGIRVYNFTVEGNHDYFVMAQTYEYGQTCILVHNAEVCNNARKSLIESGNIASKAGFTRAGFAFQKHGSRIPDPRYPHSGRYPNSNGLSREEMNSTGSQILADIVNSSDKWFKLNSYGGFDMFDKISGRGARFIKGVFDSFV